MKPYLPSRAPMPLPRRALDASVDCDVCVIGGGICGVLTAHLLSQSGARVVLLEAGRLLSGQTNGTTAKLTAQHGLFAAKLLHSVGPERARGYVQANQRALNAFLTLIAASGIDCSCEKRSAYLYALRDPQPLYDEALACQKLGLQGQIVPGVPAPLSVRAALRVRDQAQFNPFPLLASLAARLTVYEHTRATGLDGTRVQTPGGEVRARAVAVCTHYPAFALPGAYYLRLYQQRAYALALRLRADMPPVRGLLYGVEADAPSMRSCAGALIFGGESRRCGDLGAAGSYARLRRRAQALFPDSVELAHWSAQDCMTADGIPYVGRYSATTPGLFVATGFGKWGMTGAMAAAQLLCALISGEGSPYAEVFSPQRTPCKAAWLAMGAQAVHAARDLGRGLLPSVRSAGSLAPGEAAIVAHGLGKSAAYRDSQGKLHEISPYCAHMKCLLRFNPEELTWDCPCHGSRFTVDGDVVAGPAQQGCAQRHAQPAPGHGTAQA